MANELPELFNRQQNIFYALAQPETTSDQARVLETSLNQTEHTIQDIQNEEFEQRIRELANVWSAGT